MFSSAEYNKLKASNNNALVFLISFVVLYNKHLNRFHKKKILIQEAVYILDENYFILLERPFLSYLLLDEENWVSLRWA